MYLKSDSEKPFYTKFAQVLVGLIALGYVAVLGKEVLSPLIFSCLFSILLLPVARFFEVKLKFRRGGAAMLSVIILLSLIGFVIYIVGSQVSDLAKDWPQFRVQLSKSIGEIRNWVAATFHINEHKQLDYIHTVTNKIESSGTQMAGATFVSLSSVLLFMVFTFIYTFFFLLYRSLIMKFLESVFLPENKELVYEIIEQVQYIIRKYVIGLMIEMAIVATGVSITFSLMGIKYAILLGLITGLFNIIPYIGIFTALVISLLVTFATATATTKVILVLVTILITHLVDSNVLLPVIVGSKVRINALVTILGVVIGEMIWGIAGMFLSIPIIAVLKIIFDRVESLKPWGIILGDKEKKHNRITAKILLKVKR
jgi:putative permease